MKKTLKLILGSLMSLILLASCGGGGQDQPATEAPEETSSDIKRIGVIQLVEHESLDQAYKGFIDGLSEKGYTEGENLELDFNNAQGDQSNTTTIAQKLVNDQPDLIFAIATPAAQAVANQTTEIPVVITAVTDPQLAGLVDSNEAPGGNITGTSDLTPVKEQINLIKEISPEANSVGILYTSSEDNSILQAELAVEAAEEAGLTAEEFTVSKTEDIMAVTQSLVGKVDAVYIPTDNLLAANIPAVSQILTPAGIPLIVGATGMMEEGALATKGLDYYELGKQTADMAIRVLEGEDPATMAIEYQENSALYMNQKIIDELGIEIPESVLEQAEIK